ncbi:MAG: PEP-CTERM sorting domain-containing protein [Burkholderiales bacterium]|nr:PEP-CTERM sorting domain-containing protein [Burkholderiales bacterium]
MSFHSRIKALALAAVLAAGSSGAFALDNDLGPIDSSSASFSNTVGGGFTDTWTFSLSGLSYVAASLTNVESSLGSISTRGIAGLSASTGAFALTGSPITTTSGPITVTTQVLAGAAVLAAGNYTLTVSGTGITGASASYGGNIVATPVPEPGTYAMLVAGLGIVGLLVMRRRRNDD